jgi:hypothetical protein
MLLTQLPSSSLPWQINITSQNQIIDSQGQQVAIVTRPEYARFIVRASNHLLELFAAVDAFIIFTEMPDKEPSQIADRLIALMEAEKLAYAVYRKITGKKSCW